MIPTEEVSHIVAEFDDWNKQMFPGWRRVDSAYRDRYWEGRDGTWPMGPENSPLSVPVGSQSVGQARRIRPQVNLVKPWIWSMKASLFYRGVRFTMTPDPLDAEGIDGNGIEGCTAVVNSFFSREDVEAAGKQAFQTSLMFNGGAAYKVGFDPEDKSKDPLDWCWLEVVQPWEYMVDRRAAHMSQLRWAGHVYYVTREEYQEMFGAVDEKVELSRLPELTRDGPGAESMYKGGNLETPSHVRILEFYDLTGKRDEEAKRRYFLAPARTGGTNSLTEITVKGADAVCKFKSGRPATPLIPVVIDSPSDRPLENIAPVNSTYELNAELNELVADMATAYRRDWARVYAYDPAIVTEGMRAAIESGVDMTGIPVNADMTGEKSMKDAIAGAFQFIEQQPVSQTGIEYRRMLQEDIQKTQMTGPNSRGEQGQYMSATEVQSLNAYAETATGLIRQEMDKATQQAAQLFIRTLLDAMTARSATSIKVVLADKTVVKVTPKMLDRVWQIKLVESANTPLAEQQRKSEFLQILPQIENLALLASGGPPGPNGQPSAPPEVQKLAQRLLNHFVSLFGLADDLSWAAVAEGKKPTPPVPAGPPAPSGDTMAPPAPAQPEDLSGTPAAQAMMSATGAPS